MKKYILLLSVFALGLCSCEDARDIEPIDTIPSDEAFQSVFDMKLGVSGMYAQYAPENIIRLSSRMTDDLKIGADNGGQGISEINQILNPGSGSTSGIWATHYRLINLANRIIEAAVDISPQDEAEQALYTRLLGECYAMRALAHFELLSLYAPSFDADALAVPYIDAVVFLEEPPRNTVEAVFTAILNDLTTADTLLGTFADNTRATQDLSTALRAKIALFSGDHTAAIAYANELITTYPLANRNQYVAMYQDTDETEVIFKARRTVTDFFPGGLFYFTATGGAFLEMSNSLFNALDPADIRFNVLFDQVNSNIGSNVLLINKYPGIPGTPYLNDVKVYRVSEQYLIRAEAEARSGDLIAAAQTLRQLRNVRFGFATALDVYANLEEAIQAILQERRLELAYEGHRYIDLRRTRDITNQGIVRDPADCGGATPCELPVNDHRFTLPIPQGEMNGNANMEQNPGYGS